MTRRLTDLGATDDRIRIVGHIDDRHEFLDVLHHAAVYIHGHSVGGINPSLIEAMGAGARILAYDTPFNREALGPDAATFSLDPTDLVDLLRVGVGGDTRRRDGPPRRLLDAERSSTIPSRRSPMPTKPSCRRQPASAVGDRIRISTRWADPPV